jgi:hypothetical protein
MSEFIIGGYDRKYMMDENFTYANIISDKFLAI